MVYKFFLDTNILVDFFAHSREGHQAAKKIFASIEAKYSKGYVSETVINTTAYILRKDYSTNKLKEFFKEMLEILTVLSCTNKTLAEAYENNISNLEDAVLYQIALNNKLDYFISNDKALLKSISKNILPVITSKKFLEFL